MALETASVISDLVITNPSGGDQRSTADDHLRLLKACLQRTFPNIDGEMSASQGEIHAAARGEITASYAQSADFAISANHAASASFAISAGFASSASFAHSAAHAASASHASSANHALSATFATSAGQVDGIEGSDIVRASTGQLISGTKTFAVRPVITSQGGFLNHAASANEGGKVTVSTNDPTGTPADGDIWIKREA